MWSDVAERGLANEALVARDHGLTRNPDMYAVDCYKMVRGRAHYVEIKSIVARIIETVDTGSCLEPKQTFITVSKQASTAEDADTSYMPLLRTGGPFKTSQDAPGSLFILRCPEKYFFDYRTQRAKHVPQKDYYFKADELAKRVHQLVVAGAPVTRRFPTSAKKKFETCALIQLADLANIALTRDEFYKLLHSDIEPEDTMHLWRDLANDYSVPALKRAACLKGKVDAFLSLDPDPVWRR